MNKAQIYMDRGGGKKAYVDSFFPIAQLHTKVATR
jgi:hypothetical protein